MPYVDKVQVGGTDYDIQDTKAQAEVDELKSAIDYTSDVLKTGYKRLSKQAADASGVMIANTSFDTDCYQVVPGKVISFTFSSYPATLAFYTSEPSIGSTSYNSSRSVYNGAPVSNITVPTGCNWVAARVATGTGYSTISPSSATLDDIQKDILNCTVFKGTYSGSLDDVKDNSLRYVLSSVATSPFYGNASCMLETVTLANNIYIQIAYGFTEAYKGIRYTRTFGSGTWTNWVTYDDYLNKKIETKGQYTGSLDDVKDNSVRYVGSAVETSPLYGKSACMLQTVELVSGAYMQIAYGITEKYKGWRYTRVYISATWTDWVTYDTGHTFDSNPVYYAFGDSLTWGAKWVTISGDPDYEVVQTAEENRIPTRIAHAIGAENSFHNEAVGGSYFVGNTDNNKHLIDKIKATDMTGAKLITVAGGRNDSANTLGSTSSTSADGTICGAVREIIEYLQSTYKKAQIVWIGVTPNPGSNDNSKVFTFVTAGGWSLNTFDEAVSAICAEYCVPYVNWKECSYMMHWADFSGTHNVWSHPNNDESFLQMGNYAAGKVAQYYRG